MKDNTKVKDQISFVLNGKPLVPVEPTQKVDSPTEIEKKSNDSTVDPTKNQNPSC